MLRRLFTWRMNLYRLIVGAIVLTIVIPAWAVGVRWRPSSGVKVDRRRFSTRYQLEKRRTHTRDNTSITHRTAPR